MTRGLTNREIMIEDIAHECSNHGCWIDNELNFNFDILYARLDSYRESDLEIIFNDVMMDCEVHI